MTPKTFLPPTLAISFCTEPRDIGITPRFRIFSTLSNGQKRTFWLGGVAETGADNANGCSKPLLQWLHVNRFFGIMKILILKTNFILPSPLKVLEKENSRWRNPKRNGLTPVPWTRLQPLKLLPPFLTLMRNLTETRRLRKTTAEKSRTVRGLREEVLPLRRTRKINSNLSSNLIIISPVPTLRWKYMTKGGAGDCAFHAVAHCLALAQGKTIEEDKLRTEGAKLRLMAISHLDKHKAAFAPFWSPDPSETSQQRAGLGVASCFDEYLKQVAKQNFWADALLLRGLVSRIGVCLIVFKYNPEAKLWVRFALAPKFKNGIATPTSKETKPVVLLLKEGHYRALYPKSSSVVTPGPWFEETTNPDRGELRGAGGSAADYAPSLDGGVFSLPPETPCRTTSDADTRTVAGSSKRLRITGKQSIALPSATPTRGGTVSSRVDFLDFCSLKQDVHSGNEAASSSSQPKIIKGHDFHFVWTCPHCGEVFNAATAIQRRYMRNNHLRRRHKHNRTDASDKIRESIPLTPTSPLIPRDQRSWTCPQCFEGLPDLSSEHMVRKCALHHWAERRPAWHTDLRERWEHWRKGAN